MLRASSEMAVAIRVASVPENPSSVASSRPICRACTRSASEPMAISASSTGAIDIPSPVENVQALLQVQRRVDPFQAQPELHDGEGDLGPDPHDDGVRPPKLH